MGDLDELGGLSELSELGEFSGSVFSAMIKVKLKLENQLHLETKRTYQAKKHTTLVCSHKIKKREKIMTVIDYLKGLDTSSFFTKQP